MQAQNGSEDVHDLRSPTFHARKWSSAASRTASDELGDDLCSPTEYALLMAIAYSATYSMLADDPRLIEWFGETLPGLRKEIKFATEVSMSRLKLYSTKDFTALQAFTLYIVGFTFRVRRCQANNGKDDEDLG